MTILLGLLSVLPLVIVYITAFGLLYAVSPILMVVAIVPFAGFYIRDIALKLRPPYVPLGHFEADPVKKEISGAVLRVCAAYGIPPPKLFIRNDPEVNAYSHGFSRLAWNLVITSALVDFYEQNWGKIECVIAHEVAHAANGDIYYPTFVDFPASVIGRIGAALFAIPRFIKRLFKPAMMGGAISMFFLRGGCLTMALGILIIVVLLVALVGLFIYAWYFVIIAWLGVLFGVLPVTAFNRWREKHADISAARQTKNPSKVVLTLGAGIRAQPSEEIAARDILTAGGFAFDQRLMLSLLQLAKHGKIRVPLRIRMGGWLRNHPFLICRIDNLVKAFPEAF